MPAATEKIYSVYPLLPPPKVAVRTPEPWLLLSPGLCIAAGRPEFRSAEYRRSVISTRTLAPGIAQLRPVLNLASGDTDDVSMQLSEQLLESGKIYHEAMRGFKAFRQALERGYFVLQDD